MIEIKGDFWQHAPRYHALVCTTNTIVKRNGELVMGAGIAKSFAQKYPWLPKMWGERVTEYHKRCPRRGPSIMADIDVESGRFLVALPTKIDWRDMSSEHLIECSVADLAHLTDQMGWKKVLMTRPGCGCGGLSWPRIKEVICEHYLDDRFHIISND